MKLEDMSIGELRSLAKERDINSYGKSKEDLIAAMTPKTQGRKSWAPARKLDIKGREDGYVYRWCDRDPGKLEKKQAEGWIFANDVTDTRVAHENPREIEDGGTLGSAKTYREMVLMKAPKDLMDERSEYYREINDRRIRQIKDRAAQNVASVEKPGGPQTSVHGQVEIQRIS